MICELDLTDNTEIGKIEQFLSNNEFSDYMQSIKWNIIRSEERKFYLYYIENNEIIWCCNLLEKEREHIKYLYAPRGPVFKQNNLSFINQFLSDIQQWMNNNGYFKLVINPYFKTNDLQLISSNFKYEITGRTDYAKLLDSCKLAIMDIVFDENTMMSKLPSKVRQNTRRSCRKNLISKVSKNVDLDNFYKLYLQTSERHIFTPHNLEYFKKLIDVFKDDLIFLEVWHDNQPLAMSIDIIYNNKLIYLYGVSATENRNLLGMYNLQWEAIKYCIINNISKYDFGGVFCEENDINNKDYGLYTFKKGYCYNGFIDVVPDLIFTFEGDSND